MIHNSEVNERAERRGFKRERRVGGESEEAGDQVIENEAGWRTAVGGGRGGAGRGIGGVEDRCRQAWDEAEQREPGGWSAEKGRRRRVRARKDDGEREGGRRSEMRNDRAIISIAPLLYRLRAFVRAIKNLEIHHDVSKGNCLVLILITLCGFETYEMGKRMACTLSHSHIHLSWINRLQPCIVICGLKGMLFGSFVYFLSQLLRWAT